MNKKVKKCFSVIISVVLFSICVFPSLLFCSSAEEGTYALTDWQSTITDNLPVNQVNTPGTHNSATYNITNITFGFSKCQRKTVSEQFNCGVRFFDFRFTYTENRGSTDADAFTVCHSTMPCIKKGKSPDLIMKKENYIDIDDMISECSSLLEEHPTEYIIFCYHYDVGSENKYGEWKVNQMLNNYISETVNNNSDRYIFLKSGDKAPTVGDARGKVIFCLNNWSGWINDGASITNNYGSGILNKIKSLNSVGFNTEKEQNATLTDKELTTQRIMHFSTYSAFPPLNPLLCSVSVNNWFLGKFPFDRFFGIPSANLKKGVFYGWFLFDFVNSDLSVKVINLNADSFRQFS